MKKLIATTIGAAVLAATAWISLDSTYHVSVVLDSATNVVEGGTVLVSGMPAGKVDKLEVRDGKAVLDLALERDSAPLHDGAVVEVTWKALLGERQVSVQDGPERNATIPDGGMIRGKQLQPMELDQVLNALDPPTRERLTSMFRRLDSTLDGKQADVRATLRTAGPALHALGDLLRAAGTDGPANKNLVHRLNDTLSILGRRDEAMRGVVSDLSRLTEATVGQRQALRNTLRGLPPTLDQASKTLNSVPGTVDKVSPMLEDLHKATRRLPSVSKNLQPVLADLRPMVARLRPTLGAAHTLLGSTPALLDRANSVLPPANHALRYAQPALGFLRPYTPELAGWLGTWGSAAANYDSNGHYWRMHAQAGATSFNGNPGVLPPGVRKDPTPLPGANGDQPWTDAFGDGER
ncbi:MAG: MlaD family protein [Thermocrispum sp.]